MIEESLRKQQQKKLNHCMLLEILYKYNILSELIVNCFSSENVP